MTCGCCEVVQGMSGTVAHDMPWPWGGNVCEVRTMLNAERGLGNGTWEVVGERGLESKVPLSCGMFVR